MLEDLAGLVGRLGARRKEIVGAVVAVVCDVVPDPMQERDPLYAVGQRAAVAAAVDYWLTGIARGEGQRVPIPAAVIEQAHRAARGGVSLATVLRRYVAGYGRLEDFVLQEAVHSDVQGAKTVLGRVLRAHALLFDRMVAAIEVEFTDESERVTRSGEQHRAVLVRALLAGSPVEADELGYELDAWHLGIIATGARAAQVVNGLAAALDRESLSVPQGDGVVWAWLGGPRRLATAEIERSLSSEKLAGASLAAGEPGRGTDGWRLTHRLAQAALLVAQRVPQSLTRYADVALLAMALRDEVLARTLVNSYLAPLDSSRRGAAPLRETVRAYLYAEQKVSSAATTLAVSRSTVRSRLRTIEKRLGRLLPTCLAELEVALRLEELGVTGSIK